jgi:Flp pilus assembly pilin Flp
VGVGRKESPVSDLFLGAWVRVSNALYHERGQTMTEYAVVLVLLAGIVAAIGTTNIGTTIVNKIASKLGNI